MKQEDKDLLLKDLSARLPYNTVVYYKTDGWESQYHTLSPQIIDNMVHRFDVIIKPYLRPITSMTEEERIQYYNIDNRAYSCPIDYAHIPAQERIDWLNKNFFDYRGLIKKGLAIKVTEENNPYK